jgi:hypothetical protein
VKNSDPGWKKFGSRIRDKHPGSATLRVADLFHMGPDLDDPRHG